jgi:hypothetical protein
VQALPIPRHSTECPAPMLTSQSGKTPGSTDGRQEGLHSPSDLNLTCGHGVLVPPAKSKLQGGHTGAQGPKPAPARQPGHSQLAERLHQDTALESDMALQLARNRVSSSPPGAVAPDQEARRSAVARWRASVSLPTPSPRTWTPDLRHHFVQPR